MDADEREDLEVRLFLEAVYACYGYDLRNYAPASLRRRVRAALAQSGLRNLGELQHQILVDPLCFARVLETLTVRVTTMFRDPAFYSLFREQVVPIVRTYPRLNIWHAGCSSGEEVYAMAILLHEENLLERAQLYGTDLSHEAIERAKQAVYPASEVAAFEENYRSGGGRAAFSDYYSAAYDRIIIKEPLRRNIVFFQHNLVSDHAPGEMQVIVCRNVLIYFDMSLKTKVLKKLEGALHRGAFLCLGSSEHLPSEVTWSLSELAPSSRVWRRQGDAL